MKPAITPCLIILAGIGTIYAQVLVSVSSAPDVVGASLSVTDNTNLDITALTMRSTCAPQSGLKKPMIIDRTEDLLTKMGTRDTALVAAHQSKSYHLGGPVAGYASEPWNCSASLIAALFSDGSSFGDAAEVTRLESIRRFTAREVSTYLATLGQVASIGGGRGDLATAITVHHNAAMQAAQSKSENWAADNAGLVVLSAVQSLRYADNSPMSDSVVFKDIKKFLSGWQSRLKLYSSVP